jgi:flagellar hook-associated protein 1 FlgK
MTRSTFAGFTTARLAMAASQRSLDVTGQNIANINTVGYTKQQVDLVSLNLRGGDVYSSNPSSKIGYGVETTSVSQIRDPFLDVQYRNQIAKVGTADARQEVLNQLGDVFDETDKDALKTALSDLSSALDKLSANANSSEFDSIVRSRCQVLMNYIHQKNADLKSTREETISGLEKTTLPKVNSLLSDIGELNDAIYKSQMLGNPALEMMDQRNSKLDELASYVPISVSYKEVNIADGAKYNYPVVKLNGTNGTTYNLTAGDHGENFASLSVERNKNSLGVEDGTVKINLIPASDFPAYADVSALKTDITDKLREGTLKGTLDMLNKSGELDDPSSDYRGIGYYEKSFDSFVQSFAKTFNKLNENTVAYTGITNAPSKGAPTEMTGDGDKKVEYSYNFANAKGNFLNHEIININGQSYTFGDGSGDTILLGNTMEDSLENLADKMNQINNLPATTTFYVNNNPVEGTWEYNKTTKKLVWSSSTPLAAGDTIGENSIKKTATEDIDNLTYSANPLNIRNYDLFKTSDGSNIFTASNIKISDDWMNSSIHIIASHDPKAGTTASDNITLMIKALTDSREFTYEYNYNDYAGNSKIGTKSFYNGNFSQCYSNMENMQGIDSSSNTAILNNHISVLSETSNNKDAVSGVSLDEEGINLMQFQRSFSAAARLMTTLDQALDTLINSTGMVGR